MRDAVIMLLGALLCASSLFGKEYRRAPENFHTPQLRLYFYACEGSVEGVKQALDEGAEIDMLSDSHFAAIHYAIRLNRANVVDYLLKRGANPNVPTGPATGTEWKATPIIMATAIGHYEIAQLLMAAGADPSTPLLRNGMTAVSFALRENRKEFIDAFIQAGVDISRPTHLNEYGDRSIPALTYAARHGALDQVKRLVEEYQVSANPKVTEVFDSPLFAAIRHGNTEVVDYLIQQGADIHSELSHYNSGWKVAGYYPLEMAARNGRVEITRLLLESRAKPVRKISRDRDPVFLADALGYEKLLELYESHGYRSNYWARLEADTKLHRQAGRHVDSVPVESLFSAKYLEGNWETPELRPNEHSGFKIAIIGDDNSEDMTSLLTVEWSARDNIQVLERDEIDSLLREHRLTRSGVLSGQSLNEFSNILGADFLLLINKVEFGNKDAVCEFRLINARRGILLDSKLYQLKESSIESFCRDYVKRAAVQVDKFGADAKNLKFLSVVNARSDFGSLAGLQLERQAHRLLEYELSQRPDILLMERRDLDRLVQENQLSGEADDSFQAASGFIDARLALNSQRDGVESIHLRLNLKSGESLASSVALKEKDFSEALKIAIDELLDVGDSESVAASDTLNKDFEYLFRESVWLFDVGLHEESLDFVRNAIALNDDKKRAWFHYLKCLNSTYPELPQHDRFSNPSDFEKVFLHEQERLYVLDKVYEFYLNGGGEEKVLRAGHEGFEYTITLLDAVSLHRRYGDSIRLLEEDYLHLISRRTVQLFTLHQRREKLHYEDYGRHLASVLRVLRGFREVDENLIEGAVKQLFRSMSEQFSDPSFWPSRTVGRLSGYADYSGKYKNMGWMREEQLLEWAVESENPYLAYCFIAELFNDDWIYHRRYSRKRISELVQLTSRLLDRLSSREKVFYHLNSISTNNQYLGWLDGSFLLTDMRNLHIVGSYLRWEPIEDASFKLLEKLLRSKYTYKKILDGRLELSESESELVQLKHTLKVFDEFVEKFPVSEYRYSLVLNFLRKELVSIESKAQEKSEVTINVGTFPVVLWHPSAYGYEYYEPMHNPVYEKGKWYVVACDQRTREKRIKRHALFVIDAETMATEIRAMDSNPVLPFRQTIYGDAFVGGGYLYFSVNGSTEPIFCLDLSTMVVKRISGYLTHRSASLAKADVVDGKLYALVTTEEDVDNLKADFWSVQLIEYDPLAARTSVIANSRRNPPENELDRIVKNAYRVVHSEDHGGILISFGRSKLFHWDIETDAAKRRKSSSPPRVNYLDVEVRERYRELGFLTEEGHLWWKHHNRVGGKWERYAESGALLFTNWDVFPNLWKAVEFTFDTAGKQCPQFDVLNTAQAKDQISHKNFHHGVNRGYFVVNENVLAFFKTEDLAAALKESTLLPKR
jgi:ankyrin repeat protein